MPQVFLPGPHPLTGERPPVVFGHEFSGVVTEVGDGVEAVRPGDHVAVMPVLSDGTCSSCRKGAPHCCRQLGFIGIHGGGGGLSDAVVVPEKHAFKLPPVISDDIGGMLRSH